MYGLIWAVVTLVSIAANRIVAAVRRGRREESYELPDETVPSLDRVYRLYLGQQGSGKTYELKKDVEYFAGRGCLVHVLDTQNEFGTHGRVFKSVEKYEQYCDSHDVPAVTVWQLGQDPKAYDFVYQEVIREATASEDTTTCLVIDEFYVHVKTGAHWSGSDDLKEILLAGRHVTNAHGDLASVHVVGAMQYPYSSHLLVWQQANSICVGAAGGERFYKWISANFEKPGGPDVVAQAAALKPHQWLCIKGEPRPGSGHRKPSPTPK